MTAYVNKHTSIVQACLPWYDSKDPKQHTKRTRDSILKLMTGMHNDMQPLHYRSKHCEDGTLDRYYTAAPNWTNLTRGLRPRITCAPFEIVSFLIDACQCVPFVKDVLIYLIEGDDAKKVTLQELEALNIQIQPVPMLYVDAPSTSTTSSTNNGELEAARDEMVRGAKETSRLEDQVSIQAQQSEELTNKVNELMLQLEDLKKSQACLTLDIHFPQSCIAQADYGHNSSSMICNTVCHSIF